MPLGESAIPQLVIQEVYIPEGNKNNVRQLVNQDIIIYLLEIPELENIDSISSFIQTDSDLGTNNQVSQNINQMMENFPLFSHNYLQEDEESIKNNNLVLEFDEFINRDGILDAIQFVGQQLYVEGNNNNLEFYSEQQIYDLYWDVQSGFDKDSLFDNSITFDDFLEDFAGNYLIDSLQSSFQDVVLSGNNNNIYQELNQSLVTFILLDQENNLQFQELPSNLPPVQFIFQESFLDTNNNTIHQTINQNIRFDFSFTGGYNNNPFAINSQELNDPKFSIDSFILPILDNSKLGSNLFENHEVIANQNNLQKSDVFGDDNTDSKNNSQVITLSGLNSVSVALPTGEIVKNGEGNDTTIAKRGNSVFGGKGNDFLQTAVGGGDNYFCGGKGNDVLIAGTNDTLFGNKGDDLLNASLGGGKNYVYGNQGNDTFYLGANDTIFGGKGNDTFFLGKAGNNVIAGGSDQDLFWFTDGEFYSSANIITDFNLKKDSIGIGGMSNDARITFESDGQGNTILGINNLRDIAIFQGIKPSELEKANFIDS